MPNTLDPEFLKLLVCPVSRCSLVQEGDYLISTDSKTRRRYQIVDGIPDMLVEDSEELDQRSWQEIMDRH